MADAAFAPFAAPLVRAGLLCGIVAPVIYAATVVWGGTLFPGYSHLGDAISSLTEAGRPGTTGVESFFLIYNVLVLEFAFTGLSITLGHWQWTWSFAMLLCVGMLGLLMAPFPMDPIGAPVTLPGGIHIALAGLASIASMIAIGMSALALRAAPSARKYAGLALLALAVVFITGLVAASAAVAGWPLMGLFERITIGAFLVWMTALALLFLASALNLPWAPALVARATTD